MNSKTEIIVTKIRSYQTLIYKNGSKTFPKKEYIEYQKEIISQLQDLIKTESKDIKVKLHFKSKDRTIGDLDNIGKPILDCLQKNENIFNDRYITELTLKKSFNHEVNSIIIEIE